MNKHEQSFEQLEYADDDLDQNQDDDDPLEPAAVVGVLMVSQHVKHLLQDAESLAKAVWALLDDPPLRAQMIDAAARVAVSETQVLDQVLAALEPLIADAEMFKPEGISGHASP